MAQHQAHNGPLEQFLQNRIKNTEDENVSLNDIEQNARSKNDGNPFDLYDDKPGWEKASDAITTAIDENKSLDEVLSVAKRFSKFGADDTASRDAIYRFMKRKGKSVARNENRTDPAEELDAIGFPPKKKEKNAAPKHKEGDGVVYGDDNTTVLHVMPGSPNKYEIKIAGGETVTVSEDQLS